VVRVITGDLTIAAIAGGIDAGPPRSWPPETPSGYDRPRTASYP
jgi:hypothetical protein